MKKYDTYKDSGNQWIGQVPKHWEILPIKYCAELFTGNSISDRDKENYLDSTDAIPYIATKDINAQTLLADYENGMYTKKEDASFKIASKGSTLLCIEGGSAGRKKTYLTEDVSFVNKLCCFTAKENMSGKYLYYYINSNEFVETFNNHITGLIGGVSLSSLVNFKSPLPPLSEQQAIVEFLNKKTGKIDQSIALLETQKTDLQAYRQALITETVTKGLNPNAPMKDSGNQWIWQVPEHWKILPIKYCAELFTGNSISDRDKENYLDSTDAIPYIATKDINAQTLLADYENGMYTKKEDASFKIASKGSTLLCIEGGSAGRKKTYLTEDVSFVNKLCCFTAKENMSGKYLYYYINSNEFVETFNNHITGLIGGVSLSSLVNFKSPLPPLSEQQAIVEYLDKKTSDIDTAIQKINTQIADLQAYRTALISEVVTGKIDVRNQ